MYENENESTIKSRMLSKVPSDICKLEGSFIYDAISPVSTELSAIYMTLETFIDNVLIKTTSGKYLERRAEEFGIDKKEGTQATCLVSFEGKPGEYPNGIFLETNEKYKFITTEKFSISNDADSATVQAIAEECGSKFNIPKDTKFNMPIQVTNLTSVKSITTALGGTDEESDEELLKRLMARVQNPSTSGNRNHYKMWALEVDGIGDVKVITPSDGIVGLEVGDIKLIVISSDKRAVSEDMINKVKNHVDSQRPIGVNLKVETVKEKDINIEVNVELQPEYILDDIKKQYELKLEEFRKEMAFREKEISYAKIGYLLLTVPGVKNYENLTINNATQSIVVNEDEIPKITVNISPTKG